MRGCMGHYSELACAYTYKTKLIHILCWKPCSHTSDTQVKSFTYTTETLSHKQLKNYTLTYTTEKLTWTTEMFSHILVKCSHIHSWKMSSHIHIWNHSHAILKTSAFQLNRKAFQLNWNAFLFNWNSFLFIRNTRTHAGTHMHTHTRSLSEPHDGWKAWFLAKSCSQRVAMMRC